MQPTCQLVSLFILAQYCPVFTSPSPSHFTSEYVCNFFRRRCCRLLFDTSLYLTWMNYLAFNGRHVSKNGCVRVRCVCPERARTRVRFPLRFQLYTHIYGCCCWNRADWHDMVRCHCPLRFLLCECVCFMQSRWWVFALIFYSFGQYTIYRIIPLETTH